MGNMSNPNISSGGQYSGLNQNTPSGGQYSPIGQMPTGGQYSPIGQMPTGGQYSPIGQMPTNMPYVSPLTSLFQNQAKASMPGLSGYFGTVTPQVSEDAAMYPPGYAAGGIGGGLSSLGGNAGSGVDRAALRQQRQLNRLARRSQGL